MPYVVSKALPPKPENGVVWGIEIDFIALGHRPNPLTTHWKIITIYGDSLDQCLLKAHHICDMLNDPNFEKMEIIIHEYIDELRRSSASDFDA